MDPSLGAFRAFVAVVDAGTLSRAAQWLHVSTPALSQQIARLERQLDTTLFVRAASGLTPTPEGVILAELARRALDAYGDVLAWRDGTERRRTEATATIGHAGSTAARLGQAGVREAAELAGLDPVDTRWRRLDAVEGLEALDAGEIRALLVRSCDLDADARAAAGAHVAHRVGPADRVVVVVGAHTALAGRPSVAAADLRALVFAGNRTPGADVLSLRTLAPDACPAPERQRPVASLDDALSLVQTAPVAVLTLESRAEAMYRPGTSIVRVDDLDPVDTLLVVRSTAERRAT